MTQPSNPTQFIMITCGVSSGVSMLFHLPTDVRVVLPVGVCECVHMG